MFVLMQLQLETFVIASPMQQLSSASAVRYFSLQHQLNHALIIRHVLVNKSYSMLLALKNICMKQNNPLIRYSRGFQGKGNPLSWWSVLGDRLVGMIPPERRTENIA
jgi:hypothetical protein